MPSNSTPARPLRPAVFLDRDGTINVDVNYLRSPDELRLIEGAAESIQQLRAAGFLAPGLVPACAGAWWRWYWGSTEEASALA